MKILITGANGFIGKALCEFFLNLKIDFLAIEKNADIRKSASFDIYLNSQITHVIHLASKNFVPASWENPAEFFEVNIIGTTNVLEFCKRTNAKLIFISSYIYGPPQYLPINEKHPLNVFNPYSLSKKLAEECCEFYSKNFQINVTILRPFNIYGPGQNNSFLIPQIVNQVKKENKIEILDLLPRRDFLFIDDFVNSIFCLINYETKFDIFNVGSGYSVSVGEIIDLAQEINGCNKEVLCKKEIRKNEILDVVADIAKITTITNWKPKVNLKDGLTKILNSID